LVEEIKNRNTDLKIPNKKSAREGAFYKQTNQLINQF